MNKKLNNQKNKYKEPRNAGKENILVSWPPYKKLII
jgi:hypothetical protein